METSPEHNFWAASSAKGGLGNKSHRMPEAQMLFDMSCIFSGWQKQLLGTTFWALFGFCDSSKELGYLSSSLDIRWFGNKKQKFAERNKSFGKIFGKNTAFLLLSLNDIWMSWHTGKRSFWWLLCRVCRVCKLFLIPKFGKIIIPSHPFANECWCMFGVVVRGFGTWIGNT